MKIKKIIIITTILILVFSITMISNKTRNNTLQVNSNVQEISNKMIGWGVKREKDHKQPDLGSVNKAIMEKYKGLCIGSNDKKNIYLTFDQGYEAGYTEKILEVLKQNNVTATFFITAHYLNTEEELVRKMIENGNIVGNHTVNHKSMPSLSDKQIKKEVMDLHTAMYQKFNYEMKYIRPPKGEYSERTVLKTNELGYKTVMWSFGYKDWDEKKQNGEEYAKKMITDNFHNGEIMLLHATSKDNANVLDYIIKEGKKQGYEFKSLDEFE